MGTPQVSICVPTYNRAAYLPEMVESCLAQTMKDWELIVWDDGSTDSTATLMRWYEAKDSRIHYFPDVSNRGIAHARNGAISKARGKYIAVMDSDDIMAPRRLSISVKTLEKQRVDAVHGAYLRADSHAQVFDGVEPVKKIRLEEVKENLLPAHVTLLAKRECFLKTPYRDEFTSNDDFDLLVRWFFAGYRFFAIKDPLVIVRFHDQSVSVKKDREVKRLHKQVLREIDRHAR